MQTDHDSSSVIKDYAGSQLWSLLVEVVHALAMYPYHKAYVRDVALKEKPDATPHELAAKLGMPLGEALVILHELKAKRS